VKNKLLDIFSAISLISVKPSRILGLDSGIIEEGSEADISIFDIEKPWKVSSDSFYSKSKNSPFDGMLLEGKNIMTFVRGKLVYKS
jgi:dihydroorotase